MPTKTTINLAELAVIAEEFAQSTEGLTAEVVPATTLQLTQRSRNSRRR